MTSTRLPGKVLKNIAGKPVLWHVINRLRQAKLVDEIVVATTINSTDIPIISLAEDIGVASYTGSEVDVLDRYYQSAKIAKADVIVRITSDCPLLDPGVVDEAASYFLKNCFDYVSNTCVTTDLGCKQAYPDGLDTEVFSFGALENAWKNASLDSEREHVTPYIWKNVDLFKIGHVSYPVDLSHLRFTLDYEEDLLFIAEIYNRLSDKGLTFGLKDILALLDKNPALLEINKTKTRNEGYFKSLERDKLHQI
jgi:spore coat polysaccharide biosynthesis protein SpsF (cytidylyltransferase family)